MKPPILQGHHLSKSDTFPKYKTKIHPSKYLEYFDTLHRIANEFPSLKKLKEQHRNPPLHIPTRFNYEQLLEATILNMQMEAKKAIRWQRRPYI